MERGVVTTSPTRLYVVDTSVWIRLYEEHYPPDVFPTLYDKLRDCAQRGCIKSPHQVLAELGDQRKGVGLWVRTLHPTIVPNQTQAIAARVGSICEKFPDLIRGTSTSADPFVIAHAISSGGVVATEERRKIHPTSKSSIPSVCDSFSVECIDTLALLRALEIKV